MKISTYHRIIESDALKSIKENAPIQWI